MNFSMNSAMNAMNAVGASAAKVAANGAPLDSAPAATPDGMPLPGMLQAQPAAQLMPFQQWIAVEDAPPVADPALPADAATLDAAPHDPAAA